MFNANDNDPTDTLHILRGELDRLMNNYEEFLKQESLMTDVHCLRSWIDSYHQGSRETAEYLNDYGHQLLENIKIKLRAAVEEMHRIDEESPIAEHFTGHRADRLNKAAALASKAERKMEKFLENESAS